MFLWLVSTVLGTWGVSSFFTGSTISLGIGAVAVIGCNLYGLITGQLRGWSTSVYFVILGIIASFMNNASIWWGILFGFCLEGAVLGIIGGLITYLPVIFCFFQKKDRAEDSEEVSRLCKHCGTEYLKEDDVCPNCKKPVQFKVRSKRLVYALTALLVFSIVINAYMYLETSRMKEQSVTSSQLNEALVVMMVQKVEPMRLTAHDFSMAYVAVITETGQKYHAPNCKYLSNSANLTICSVSGAKATGFSPCTVCRQ